MARRIFLFWALLVFLVLTEAQEGDPADPSEPQEPGTFPVSLLLEAAEAAGNGEPLWRPDWPMELPPDAFRFSGKEGEAPLLSVEVSIVPADASVQRVYRFSRDREGRVREFPFLLYRKFFQAEFSYHDKSDKSIDEAFDDSNNRPLVAAVALKGPEGTDPLNLEVLEQEDSRLFLIRVLWGGIYSFVSIAYRKGGIFETWYDVEGRFLDVYEYIVAPQAGGDRIVSCMLRGRGREEQYYYDSRGFVTRVSGPLGNFSVLYYREDLPRYWNYLPAASGGEDPEDLSAPGAYSFRWDETPLLLGLSGTPAEEGQDPVDRRYVYTLDEKGNWIERREIRLIHRLGLLVPSPGSTITRILEYRGEEE
jgi:hypothetical protein